MKRYVVSIVIVMAVLIAAFSAFGQDADRANRAEQRQNMKERFQNMSPEEREKFRAEMQEKKQQWENMSAEERSQLRAEMRERYGSSSRSSGYEQQLKSIKAIESQVAKLKRALEVMAPENRSRLNELSKEESKKLREEMNSARAQWRGAINAIEKELARLKGPDRSAAESKARLTELRAIHKLAVKENATQTAERLDKLIMAYQRGSVGREREPREGQPRQRRERPVRQEETE